MGAFTTATLLALSAPELRQTARDAGIATKGLDNPAVLALLAPMASDYVAPGSVDVTQVVNASVAKAHATEPPAFMARLSAVIATASAGRFPVMPAHTDARFPAMLDASIAHARRTSRTPGVTDEAIYSAVAHEWNRQGYAVFIATSRRNVQPRSPRFGQPYWIGADVALIHAAVKAG